MSAQTIDSYHGEAVLICDDGDRVECVADYAVEQQRIPLDDVGLAWTPGLARWHGTLKSMSSVPLTQGMLELPDGRTGRVVVYALDAVDITSQGSAWAECLLAAMAHFHGSGPAPGHT